MNTSIITLMTLLVSVSCYAQETALTSMQQLADKSGRTVVIQGIYTEMLLPKSKRPGSPLIKTGRIEITMDDGSVALETHALGLRPEEEKTSYLGKRVTIRGTYFRIRQLFGQPHEQAIVHPAIVNITKIE